MFFVSKGEGYKMNVQSSGTSRALRLAQCALISMSFLSFAFATEARVSVDRVDGEILYNIKDAEGRYSSRLVFPYKLDTATVGLKFELPKEYWLLVEASMPIQKFNSEGEDFDWIMGKSTIYSSSFSDIQAYRALNVTFSKSYRKNLDFFLKMGYSYLNTQWHNTSQISFLTNARQFATGQTIDFRHTGYKFSTGMEWRYDFGYGLRAIFAPHIDAGYARILTNYHMRDVDFTQDVFPFGFGIGVSIEKSLGRYGTLGIGLDSSFMKDAKSDAKLNVNGVSYNPASDYKSSQYSFGVYYRYDF